MKIDINENILATKVSIDIFYLAKDERITQSPYFFIKWVPNDKRYRISVSFRYLNEKYGLRINIIRDIAKIEKKMQIDLYSFFKNLLQSAEKKLDEGFRYWTFYDGDNQTEIFFLERDWHNDVNHAIVFFSLKYWKIEDYLKEVIK